jgi:hypothetical protein
LVDELMNRILPLPSVALVLQAGLLARGLEPANPQTNAKVRAIFNSWEDAPCLV